MLPTSLKIVMLTTFVAAMFGWHRIVVVIVANYGVVGSAVTCAALCDTAVTPSVHSMPSRSTRIFG